MSMRSYNRGSSPLMNTLLFSFAMILVFTLVANLLPQVEGEAPVEKEVNLGELTMDSFIALGESLFSGKGTCTLCHNAMGRAPDLLVMNAAAAAEERLADDRYKGKASDVASYFRESMVNPGVYVVAGFGKKGSNDSESPMPAANKPPIELSEIEMDAIIAFLQSKDGNDVTVALPTEAPAVVTTEGTAAAPSTVAAAGTGEEVAGRYGCQACHSMLGTESPVGPSLAAVGDRLDREFLRESILQPDKVIAEGFNAGMMPPDFADKMTVKELGLLLDLLLDQKGGVE